MPLYPTNDPIDVNDDERAAIEPIAAPSESKGGRPTEMDRQAGVHPFISNHRPGVNGACVRGVRPSAPVDARSIHVGLTLPSFGTMMRCATANVMRWAEVNPSARARRRILDAQ